MTAGQADGRFARLLDVRAQDPFRYQTKTDLAVSYLRSGIQLGEFGPGERIEPAVVADALSMSITPVREALRILEADGLVVAEAHRSFRVAEFDPSDIDQLYALRALVESRVTAAAVPRLTDADITELGRLADLHGRAVEAGDRHASAQYTRDWHMKLYASAFHAPHLVDFIDRLWRALPWMSTWMVPARNARSVIEHAELMVAIRARDAEAAEALMHGHIMSGREHLTTRLRSWGGPAASDARRDGTG